MEPKSQLSCLKELATGNYPKGDKYRLHSYTLIR